MQLSGFCPIFCLIRFILEVKQLWLTGDDAESIWDSDFSRKFCVGYLLGATKLTRALTPLNQRTLLGGKSNWFDYKGSVRVYVSTRFMAENVDADFVIECKHQGSAFVNPSFAKGLSIYCSDLNAIVRLIRSRSTGATGSEFGAMATTSSTKATKHLAYVRVRELQELEQSQYVHFASP